MRSAAALAHTCRRWPLPRRCAPGPLLLPCRRLHVFARTTSRQADYTKVLVPSGAQHASDLKDAVIAKLRLGAAPHYVRLLREVEGGAPVALDSCAPLAALRLAAGDRVIVEVRVAAAAAAAPPAAAAALLLPPPQLPAPLAFAEARLGGELLLVAPLPYTRSVAAPFYLTPAQHAGLQGFMRRAPSTTPRMLMLTGPVKSGKTRLVHDVLPRLLAARHAADPAAAPRPVIFRHTFLQGVPEERAAEHLVDGLLECARSEGVDVPRPLASCLFALPAVAAQLAQGVARAGGQLWLLLDELGAPIVASEPAGARLFTQQLKALVGSCAPHAHTVGTGSSMVALLAAIRDARPHGFALWDAIEHVSLGREPRAPAALAMAQGILAAYATQWPPAVALAVTPEAVLAQLARSAHGELTSPRPALVACLASLVDSSCAGSDGSGSGGSGGDGSGEGVLVLAVRALLKKLRDESAADTATALQRMSLPQRRALRALAVHGLAPSADAAGLAALLCEPSSPPRLLPPYGALLRSWIASDGSTAISAEGDSLEESVVRNLSALHALHGSLSEEAAQAASAAALHALAGRGVGVGQEGTEGAAATRAPATVEEFAALPATQALLRLLDQEARARAGARDAARARESPPSAQLSRALRAEPGSVERQLFMHSAGLTLLLWVRRVGAHVYCAQDELPRAGLSGGAVKDAVQAVLEVLVRDGGFAVSVAGVLCRTGAPLAPAPAPPPAPRS